MVLHRKSNPIQLALFTGILGFAGVQTSPIISVDSIVYMADLLFVITSSLSATSGLAVHPVEVYF